MRPAAQADRTSAVGSGSSAVADSRGDVGRLVEERGGGFEVPPLAVDRGQNAGPVAVGAAFVLFAPGAERGGFVSGYGVGHTSPQFRKAQPAAVA